jgi:hypothetical protein
MSYENDSAKPGPRLESGAALSTLFFDRDDEATELDVDPVADTERQPPRASRANDPD